MDGLPTPRRYFAILAICLGTALSVIDGTIVTVALPTIARDLGIESSSSVLVVTVYQLTLVMMVLPFSALGARIGVRRLYQYGQLTFTVATVLCFFAKSLPFLLVVRAAQALGAAAALSVSSALVRAVYPTRQLGRGLSLNSMVVASVSAVAPSLGGFILSLASWPWIFAAAAPFGVLSLWLGRRALPESQPHKEPYNVLGAVLCALTFGLTISGLESMVHGDSPVVSLAIVAAGVIIGFIFFKHELEEKAPVLPVDLLAKPALSLSVVGGLLAFVGSMTLMLSLPFRLQEQYGFSPTEVGAVITPWPAIMMVVAPIAGALSDRIPAGILGSIGSIVATAGLLLLAFIPENATHLDIAWRMAVGGAGISLYVIPNSRLIVGSAPIERASSAGGLISTTRLTGQTLGATVLAVLLSLGVGDGRVPALVAAALTAIAGICSVARLNPSIHRVSSKDIKDIDEV